LSALKGRKRGGTSGSVKDVAREMEKTSVSTGASRKTDLPLPRYAASEGKWKCHKMEAASSPSISLARRLCLRVITGGLRGEHDGPFHLRLLKKKSLVCDKRSEIITTVASSLRVSNALISMCSRTTLLQQETLSGNGDCY